MAVNLVKLPTKKKDLLLRVAKGHFATSHSHINYYIDVTMQKTRLSEARAVGGGGGGGGGGAAPPPRGGGGGRRGRPGAVSGAADLYIAKRTPYCHFHFSPCFSLRFLHNKTAPCGAALNYY